ncbi:MAG: hypothetical protein R3Y05_05135 [bacterium]
MITNTVLMKRFKRTLSVVTVAALMITLAGCSSTADKYPTGGLNSDAVYATSGNYKVTQGELYTELRHNGLGYLNQQIELATFDDYMKNVDITDKDQKTLVAEYILEDIYGTSDEDDINDMKATDRKLAVTKYVDTVYLEGIIVATSNLDDALTVEQILGNTHFNTLFENKYSIRVAQYLYAVDCLNKEIDEHNEEAADDEDMDVYFTDSKIANYYDSNYSNEEDVNAVIIRFINQTEATNVLRKFGIKTYNGEWFLIQPPKDKDGNTDFSKWSNESDYNKYYDEYTINQNAAESADSTITAASGTDATILKLYVEIYNYIYTYRSTLAYNGTAASKVTLNSSSPNYRRYYDFTAELIHADNQLNSEQKAEEKDLLLKSLTSEDNTNSSNLTFGKEKLDTFSTSLTSYLHNTLRTSPELDDDGVEQDFIQYTSSARSYGSNYYLIYKLSDAVEREFYTIEEDEDGEEYYDFKIKDGDENQEENKKIYDEILVELFDAELTSSYISGVVSERNDYVTVAIYDSVFEFYYKQANSLYTSTKKSSDDLVALITFKNKDLDLEWEYKVSVENAFAYLENNNGPETAVALLFNQYIQDSTYYSEIQNDEENYDLYKDSINFTLTNFANDAYSSYGYPASIGKYSFMQSYYRTANVDEAIDYLMLQDAKRDFFLENTTTEAFYKELQEFASTAYENFYSLTLTSIEVYVDMDEDGVADDGWFYTDTNNSALEYEYDLDASRKQTLVNELIIDIINYAKTSSTNLETSLADAVNEFNSSSRIEPSTDDDKLAGNVENTWAKYRKHGLYIKVNAIGEHSNTTTLDATTQELVESIYNNNDLEVMFNNTFSAPYLITDSKNFIVNEDQSTVSLLLVTGGTGKVEVDAEGEDEDLYGAVPIRIDDSYKIFDLTSNPESKEATYTQLEVYCREYFNSGSSTSLPTSASSYLNTYLDPVLTKFNSEVVQLMVMINALEVNSTATDFNSRLDSHIEYSQRISDNYVDTTDVNNNFYGFWTSDVLFKGGAN